MNTGKNEKVIVLLHPSAVQWDFFKYMIPLLEKDYHLVILALPGYDEEQPQSNFTSVEEVSDSLAKWLFAHGIQTVALLYGCSMGGAILIRMFAERKVNYRNVVCDGGITPYELPWLVTRLIAVRDYIGISLGKHPGGEDSRRHGQIVLHRRLHRRRYEVHRRCAPPHEPQDHLAHLRFLRQLFHAGICPCLQRHLPVLIRRKGEAQPQGRHPLCAKDVPLCDTRRA